MKIKAVVFPKAGRYRVNELTPEKPGRSDIEVRTLVSAISPGTERWILRGKHAGTRFPCVPGYHRIGIVASCGRDVKNFQPGDVVYGSAGRWEEPVHSMWGAHVSASVGDAGGYTFISSALPAKFELETTAFTIVAGVAVRGINACGISPGEKVVIIGGGFIGICAAQLARFQGAEAVIIDNDAERVSFAKQFAESFRVDEPGLDEKLSAIAPGGFDVLYDTAGVPSSTDMLIRHTRRGGTLLLQAQYFDRERCAIDLDAVKIKEITVKTTCGVGERDWKQTFEMIRSRTLKIGPLITHRFKSGCILKGYELLDSGKPFNLGIVFDWN